MGFVRSLYFSDSINSGIVLDSVLTERDIRGSNANDVGGEETFWD